VSYFERFSRLSGIVGTDTFGSEHRLGKLVREAAMKQHPFGKIGRQVAAIGQGTWQIEGANRRTAIATLQRGIELGMTHIDTAEMYDAIERRRDKVFIVSKVLPQHASHSGTVTACEQSLRNLKIDHLDCYLLHWRGRYPLEETIAAFESLKRDGKILSWGVSNFDVGDLEEAAAIAGAESIACNQVLYHLRERAVEHRVLPWCEKHGIALVGYSPYGHSAGTPKPASKDRGVLDEIAAAHKATPRQVALNFLTRRPSLFTIPKSSSIAHVEENAGAAKFELTTRETRRIDQAFPNRGRGDLPVL